MLAAALTLSAVALPPKTWYGPATATFNVEFAGNPYDPAENDVRVRFLGPKGDPIERIAYYDEAESAWKAVLVTSEPGKYQPKLFRNGVEKIEPPVEGLLDVTEPLKGGYIRTDSNVANRFRRDDGTRYVPLGFNLAWQTGGLLPMAEQIGKLGKTGGNWTRIWANHWDAKNPWWPQSDPQAPLTELWEPAIQKWQTLVDACDKNGVAFQMVFFHHGAFSSRVNPNWPDHPWNAKNGGFLKDAADFFTDAEAKRRAKIWLRYAVARWAHSPSVMAWELFNEVEWVDARYADRWPDIEAWHAEMADYLRSLDPYGHLVTTSSAMDRKDLWTKMDYLQPHVYSPNVLAAIAGAPRETERPSFYGEFGADDMAKADPRAVARDGILAGLFGNQAGAGQFWYWDIVEGKDLYGEFAAAAKVIAASDYANHPNARPIELRAETIGRADLVLSPGTGWEKAAQTTFNLPADATPAKLRGLPSYFQGQAGDNKALFPGPLTLRFTADRPGVVRVRVNQAAKGGTALELAVDGKVLARKEYAATTAEQNVADVLEAKFEAGTRTVTLTNLGKDWVRLSAVEVTDLAPQARAVALADPDWALIRLTGGPSFFPSPATGPVATLIGLPFRDGDHPITIIDLETAQSSPGTLKIAGGKATVDLKKDVVIVVKK
ncbi:MAG: hypothetical protein ACO1SV_05595 [Fimbriimonas sp.]